MRRIVFLLIGLAVGILIGLFAYRAMQPGDFSIEPIFSPGAEGRLIELIQSANKSIDVEMFEFSNVKLQDALVDADKRGVRVRVILEPRLNGPQNVNAAERLRSGGVEVRWASLKFANTHSKNAIFDSQAVFVGSPNWSRNGMNRNRESAVAIRSKSVAGEFEDVFEGDWREARVATS